MSASASTIFRPMAGIRSPRSVGVTRYVDRLAELLAAIGLEYVPSDKPRRGFASHLHFANSSRRALLDVMTVQPAVVTVHDVLPRTDALIAWYRRIAYPLLRRASATVVHSEFAADLLRRLGARPKRLEVIPHPVSNFGQLDQDAARRKLGWETGLPLFVLPGVLKAAKLVVETLEAAAPLLERRALGLALVGTATDRTLVARARALGAIVVESPRREQYEQAIVAADCVLVLRNASVGESNGPLLDALGAERPILATAIGSIPELAGDSAVYCVPTVTGIRRGLESLCDQQERAGRERLAQQRARLFDGTGAARAHLELFRETLGG